MRRKWDGDTTRQVEVHPETGDDIQVRAADTAAVVVPRWTRATTGDTQRVDLVAPNGKVYESMRVPLNSSGEADVRLALRGSFIEEYRLTGTWTARFFVCGGTAPVLEKTFEVLP